jgi:hypothetical protein
MFPQPGGHGLGGTVGQHINRATRLDVDQHGPVDMPTQQREVVDPQDLDGPHLGIRQRMQQAQQRVAAHAKPERRGQSRPGAPGQRPADRLQHPARQRGAPSMLGGQTSDLLGERPNTTVAITTEEPTYLQP